MIKESIHQENIKNCSGHAPEFQTFKYMKEMLSKLKREIDSDTV